MIWLYSDDKHSLAGIKDFSSKQLVINDWFTKIESEAIKENLRLQELIIPDTVTEIGGAAFSGCKSLKSIKLPTNIISMGPAVFSGCVSLRSACFPHGWTSTYDNTFEGCTSLQQVEIPSTIECIGLGVFSECTSLKHISIPDNVARIKNGAFFQCSSLQSIKLPKQLTTIAGHLFNGCSSLQQVNIPDGVKEIGDNAFFGCEALTEIRLPEGLEKIGSKAFASSGIRKIIIPWTVGNIQVDAFSDCRSLESIEISGENPSYKTIDGVLYDKSCTTILVYPPAKKTKKFSTPESVIVIEAAAFCDCQLLEDVVITKKASKIKSKAFSGCKNLKSVVIEGCVEEIEESTFIRCSTLHNIVLPSTLKYIRKFAFQDCSSLEEIVIPASTKRLGFYAFCNCASLKVINIPSQLKPDIYDKRKQRWKSNLECVLQGCYSLQHVDVDEGNWYYSSIDGVLYDKAKTELVLYPRGKLDAEYVIPDSLKHIDWRVFIGCTNLKRIEIPSRFRTCPSFEECKALECFTITGALEIWDGTFKGCLSLKELHIRVDDIYTVRVSDLAFEDAVYHRCNLYVYAEHVQDVKYYPGLRRFKNVKIETK